MRILHTVESYLPSRHGMSEVVRQISEGLVKKGHIVVVATSYNEARSENVINGVKVEQFKISGSYVRGYSGEVQRYREYIINEEFDVVANFAAQQWATDIFLENIKSVRAKKVFVPTGFSGLKNPDYQKYFALMRDWLHEFDINIFLSDSYQDVIFARENNISKLTLIPNAASREEFDQIHPDIDIRRTLKLKKKERVILHVGSYTSLKGHDQALDIYCESECHNSALVFIGDNFNSIEAYSFVIKSGQIRLPTSLGKLKTLKLISIMRAIRQKIKFLMARKRVILSSLRREELVELYKVADLFLFPSMIECSPIVLFEACASKTCFLTTDVGNTLEITSWTGGGRVMQTTKDSNGYSQPLIRESARELNELMGDDNERNRLATNGYLAWRDNFTWENAVNKYNDVYESLVSEK